MKFLLFISIAALASCNSTPNEKETAAVVKSQDIIVAPDPQGEAAETIDKNLNDLSMYGEARDSMRAFIAGKYPGAMKHIEKTSEGFDVFGPEFVLNAKELNGELWDRMRQYNRLQNMISDQKREIQVQLETMTVADQNKYTGTFEKLKKRYH